MICNQGKVRGELRGSKCEALLVFLHMARQIAVL
jgi:hypothetical protein